MTARNVDPKMVPGREPNSCTTGILMGVERTMRQGLEAARAICAHMEAIAVEALHGRLDGVVMCYADLNESLADIRCRMLQVDSAGRMIEALDRAYWDACEPARWESTVRNQAIEYRAIPLAILIEMRDAHGKNCRNPRCDLSASIDRAILRASGGQ